MVNGAQMRFNDFTDAITESFDAIKSGTLTAAEAWDKATNWAGNEEGYERLRETQELWEDAGLSAEEATKWTGKFHDANTNMDAEAMKALLVEFEAVANEAERMNSAFDAAVSAYGRAKDAGVDAYDEIYEAAIASGMGQEAAAAKATAAQVKETARVLKAEGEKYVQLARFEAALEAIRSGNAEGAAAAADRAAQETQDAWEIATAAVAEADQIASDGMRENNVTTADDQIDEAERAARGINKALAGIEDQQVVIDYHGRRTGAHDGAIREAAGGAYHVTRPTLFLAGEAGPEDAVFSGANRSLTGGPIGAAGGAQGRSGPSSVTINVKLDLDGDELTEETIKLSPRILDRLGLTP